MAYFRELWGSDPFPWQVMLAERVSTGAWPNVLDLPTAAGKTACLDIAVFALAAQAGRPIVERTAPRRIWLVVDRRIVVDEAFERASRIARALAAATEGPLRQVADRLRALSGTERPLAVGRLRGGVLRDDGWARIPSQPAVITSTVDQLGSRLLFRGYGYSLLSAPIFAGLAANDSLILLDEAHCAVPFMQTLGSVAMYRSSAWAEEPIPTPFASVLMSATPPQGVPSATRFPGVERARALDHPALARRLGASKPTELVRIPQKRGAEADPLVAEAAARAMAFVRAGRQRIAVMLNRVRTAMEVEASLREHLDEEADVVLLTGRIRPWDRQRIVERWTPFLRASQPSEPVRPVVVVTTQCLEVGADFSFDALVAECASLDALRQRFGRLARLGSEEPVHGVILARQTDVDGKEPDPIYGWALCETWSWLLQRASEADGTPLIDMGVEALQERLDEVEDLASLLAPSPDAPMLLPAHLDLLCQTSPAAHPEPDVSLYLHGQPAAPEVAVVWRCDLPPDDASAWVETVALCPPVSGEMLQASLRRVRAWLGQKPSVDEEGDVEGPDTQPGEADRRIRPCVVWRGRDQSRVVHDAAEIRPGDVVVVPACYELGELGQALREHATGEAQLDIWEVARAEAGHPALRLTTATLRSWATDPHVGELLMVVTSPAPERAAIQEAIQSLLDSPPRDVGAPPGPPDWWLKLLAECRTGTMVDHPSGGVILVARAPRQPVAEVDLFADDDDLTSAAAREVSLDDHSELVRRAAERIVSRCLPDDLGQAVRMAAYWHDAGKLDPRFQLMLHQGDEIAWATAPVAIAKSAAVPTSPARRRAIREASGLPGGFRHEMLSMELVRRFGGLPQDGHLTELVLHLVASHHGHARPFAPICPDPMAPDLQGELGGTEIFLDQAGRSTIPPAHRLDSGVAERFWRLTRRYGWWGLAYLEAIVRLADWYASNYTLTTERTS